MSRNSKLAALFLLSAIAASPVFAESKPVATVNGIAIPQERVDLRVKIITTQSKEGQTDTPDLRKAILDDMINIEVMTQEAIKNGLDKQSEIIQQLALARQQVLVSAFVQDYVKNHPLSENDLKHEYESLKGKLGGKEYNVRHILVEKESEAKSLVAKLKKGSKFDKLAEANSKDPGSRDKGGDLGWIPAGSIHSSFVKPFADALMNLSKGQVSDPVQSQYGWHLIKLEEVRDLNIPPYDELKPQLAQSLQQQAVHKLIDDLRAKAKIE